MVHGSVRGLFQLLGALAMIFLLFAAWLGFRLTSGPLSLDFLTPYIEDALSGPDHGLTVRLDDTVLLWDTSTRTLEIRVHGVRAINGDGLVIAAGPEMSVGLSGPALLHGVLAPRSLRFYRPQIHLLRDAQGSFSIGLGDVGEATDSAAALEETFAALLVPPNANSPTGQLQRVEVIDATVLVEDRLLGRQWHLPWATLRFLRDAQGISGTARLAVDLDGGTTRLSADGHYRMAGRLVEASLSYGGLRPSLLAALVPPLKPLAALQLPTGGSIDIRYGLEQGLTDLHFDLAGGAGEIDATAFGGGRWPVTAVALRGTLSDGLNRAQLDELRVDLGGPLFTLSGHADGLNGALRLEANARLDDLPVDDIKTYWPAGLAPNPRAWVTTNLFHGRVRDATLHLAAHLPPEKPATGKVPSEKKPAEMPSAGSLANLQIDQLSGEVVPEGVTVQYLRPMPVVQNVAAVAHYDQNAFVIDLSAGQLLGLSLAQGRVTLSGLSAHDQFADIALKIGGPIADALSVIDSKPLGWAHQLGMVPSRLHGEAQTSLEMHIPLLSKLSLDQVKVLAQAQTQGVAIPGVALGQDLSDGTLALTVDNKGLDVSGKAQLGGLPADLSWRENFTQGAPFRNRYLLQTSLDDAGRKLVGLAGPPFQAPFLSGAVPVEVMATLFDGGRGDIDIKATLNAAAMALPGLNWRKAAGSPAQASALLRLENGRLSELPRFAVAAETDGLEVSGRVAFADGLPRRVSFERAKWGRTDLHGSLTLKAESDGLEIEASGDSFDAREMLAGTPSGQPKPPREDRRRPRPEQAPLEIHARVRQAWVTDDGAVHDVVASLRRDRRDWQQMRLEARVGEKHQPMRLEIEPASPASRSLKLTGGDAGAVFRAFGVFENVEGGQLLVEARYDDADPLQPLRGLATVSDYHVLKAPALARLLTVAALTGILDVLADQGISFSTLEAPFTLRDGLLDLHDARASGPALGLTAKGQIDLDENRLALEGSIVPAYMLNSALGNLPLVGGLFSAEKGGGLVAMTYAMKGPMDDPSVRVNPLSALTPGFLRRLFNIFDDGHGTELRGQDGAPLPFVETPPTVVPFPLEGGEKR